jgi:hypothetical protein
MENSEEECSEDTTRSHPEDPRPCACTYKYQWPISTLNLFKIIVKINTSKNMFKMKTLMVNQGGVKC